MLTPVCFAAMLKPVEKLELGLTKRSLRQKTVTISNERGDSRGGLPIGSQSVNPRSWAVTGLLPG